MAQVAFISAGAGNQGAGNANLSVAYPSSLQANDLILFAVTIHDTTSTPTTPSGAGFAVLYGPDRHNDVSLTIYYKFATGSESGSVSVTPNAASVTNVIGRMYSFRNVALTSFTEGASAGGNTTDIISARSVTTTGPERLALNVIAVDDDDAGAGDSFTGETGGDWAQAVAEHHTSNLNDGSLDLQIATMASAGTISGGTSPDFGAANDWVIRAFALIPKNDPPTIALNTADATDFAADTTPTLEFTGTDSDSDDVRYNVQVFNVNPEQYAVVDSYSETNQGGNSNINLAAGGFGQSFTGNGERLGSVSFYLKKAASPTGTGVAKVYAHSGIFGTSSVPTGDPLAVSEPLDVSTLTTSYQLINLEFSENITLTNGTKYVVTFEYLTADNTNMVTMGTDITSPTHGGNWSQYAKSSSTWSAANTIETIFYIYSIPAPTLDEISGTDSGFANTVTGGDTDPFNSGEKVSFTVQAGDALAGGTYYWRARAIDPSGSNTWSAWATPRSFEITAGASTLSVNKSDAVSVTESIKLQVDSYINKSDSISVSESLTALLVSLVSVSDSISVSESLLALLVSLVSVSDSVSVAESVTVAPPLSEISASDNISVAENVSVAIESLAPRTVAVQDEIAVSEALQLQAISFIAVSDSIGVAEVMTVLLVSLISISDAVSVSESVNAVVGSFPIVVDSLTVSESVSVAVPHLGGISVSDVVTVSEAVQLQVVSYVSVSDDVTVAESATPNVISLPSVSDSIGVAESVNRTLVHNVAVSESVSVLDLPQHYEDTIYVQEAVTVQIVGGGAAPTLSVTASETITVAEAIELLPISYISESEEIAVSEAISLLLLAFIAVSDSVSVSEALSLLVESFVTISDSVAVAEAVMVAVPNMGGVSVSDLAQVAEEVRLEVVSFVPVSEEISVTEAITLQGVSSVAVSDSIGVTEAVSVTVSAPQITVSDGIVISETLDLLLIGSIAVNDSISVAEATNQTLVHDISVSDSIGVAESAAAEVTTAIAVTESISVSENVLLEPQGAAAHEVSVSDSIGVAESVTLFSPLLRITVSDAITVSENRAVNVPGFTYAIHVFEIIGPYKLIIMDGKLGWRITGRHYIKL